MISVIVPIFNAEKFLSNCIESVLKQKVSSIELILINDGSTDTSLDICMKYAEIDERVVVYDKSNSGVSSTRNIGIELAKGEYVMFLDADDYLLENALMKIETALIDKNNPDMMVWGYTSVGDIPISNDSLLLEEKTEGFTHVELLDHLLCIDSFMRFRGFVWRCIFKNRILNKFGIRFATDIRMAEDYKFIFDVVLAVKDISVLSEELYAYRINDASVTARYKPDIHTDMHKVNEWVAKRLEENNMDFTIGLECCCAETYLVAIQNLCSRGSEYSYCQRVLKAWRIKNEFQYGPKIKTASKQSWKSLKRKKLSYWLFRLHLEPIYIFLFSIKRDTLIRKKMIG